MEPTNEQKNALGEALATGRDWKARLRHAWETGDYTGFNPDHVHLLQQIRNQFGPTWLTKVRAKDLTV
jgi:hypothetical protein